MKSLFRRLRRGIDSPDPEALSESLERWYTTPVGESIRALENDFARQSLRMYPGFRSMFLSLVEQPSLFDTGPHLHHFSISNRVSARCGAIADFDALPLPGNIVNVVLLQHVLDYAEHPHAILKEAARVTLPSGHLVLFGFNPLSFLGLLKWPFRLFGSSLFWRCRMFSVWRLTDWLKLLGFEVELVRYGGFSPPVQSRRFLRWMAAPERFFQSSGLPFGDCYMIVARKLVARPLYKPQRAWLSKAIAPLGAPEGGNIPRRKNQSDRTSSRQFEES